MVMVLAFTLGVLFADAGKFDLGYELKVRQAYTEAYKTGAEAMEVLRVVDQDGIPVSGAFVYGALECGASRNDYISIRGETDTNGEYVVKGPCKNFLRCSIFKEGYYVSIFDREYYNRKVYPPVVDGKWQPFGETSTVLLNQILDPTSLIGHWYEDVVLPPLGEWRSFDLEKNDWVKPFGKGEFADLRIRMSKNVQRARTDFTRIVDITFSHQPYAGFYIGRKSTGTDLQTPYHVDVNLLRETAKRFEYTRIPNREIIDTTLDKDSYLVFRTRTKVDSEGNLVSAHYGMIVGPWQFKSSQVAQCVYFNRIPNDINLEDAENARQSCLRYRQFKDHKKGR